MVFKGGGEKTPSVAVAGSSAATRWPRMEDIFPISTSPPLYSGNIGASHPGGFQGRRRDGASGCPISGEPTAYFEILCANLYNMNK
jgi:hypothetical protein